MTNELEPRLEPGDSPLLISIPHSGTGLPDDLRPRLTPVALGLPDTDWFVDRLYHWANAAGAGVLTATASRYVVDLNRPPDDAPLYDADTTLLTTGIAPAQDFGGRPLYRPGAAPGADEVTDRIGRFWQPYHALLRSEVDRIRARHGFAVLLDAHSIRHELPLLFDGSLPDLNLGSNGGSSADSNLRRRAYQTLDEPDLTRVLDGRFRGGYITRHYGRPNEGVHALQLEIAQRAYMQEEPPAWKPELSERLQAVLRRLVDELLTWKPDAP
ncbi:N-formylglutamate deformylase [Elongatibacter sediminis]|uniref:N-formylglutamate deformylase n=1 Tax=Elongatibacter sediminis TaxID=3119006 RepID=A0AAW9RPJ3_9GAMM